MGLLLALLLLLPPTLLPLALAPVPPLTANMPSKQLVMWTASPIDLMSS